MDLVTISENLTERFFARLLELLRHLPWTVSIFTHEVEGLAWAFAATICKQNRIESVAQLNSHDGLDNDCELIMISSDTNSLEFFERWLILVENVFDVVYVFTHSYMHYLISVLKSVNHMCKE